MINNTAYKLSSTNFETHLMKNSDWAAVAYMEKYLGNTHEQAIKEIAKASGQKEFVASYNQLIGGTLNYNVRANGSSLVSADARHIDINGMKEPYNDARNYSGYEKYLGNAMFETSTSGTGNTSWNNESSVVPVEETPFVVRTGRYGYTGVSGASDSSTSFRPVISVKQNPVINGHAVSILKNSPGGTVSGMNYYTNGQTVTITATGSGEFYFKGWKVVRGGVTLSSTTAATATFTMPNNDVEIYAIFN